MARQSIRDISYQMIRENFSHGDIRFHLRLHEFCTDISRTERVSSHWHDEYELLMVTNGNGIVRRNTQTFTAQENDIFFFDSGEVHSFAAEQDTPFDFIAVIFGMDLLGSYTNDDIQQKYINRHVNGELVFKTCIRNGEEPWQELKDSMLRIREAVHGCQENNELLIKADVLRIWHFLCSFPQTDSHVSVRHHDRVLLLTKQILQYIHENYMREISVRELSARFTMSEAQFCRFFKSQVNMTAIEYVNYYRIGAACTLLEQKSPAISDVAIQTGFSNISYFNRTFRRYMHCTPTEFRRKAHSGQEQPDADKKNGD